MMPLYGYTLNRSWAVYVAWETNAPLALLGIVASDLQINLIELDLGITDLIAKNE